MRPQLRTEFSSHAVGIAETFKLAVASTPVGEYKGELTSPEASTGGGVRGLQHVRLVSSDPATAAIVVGHAHAGEKSAELRTFEYIDAVHRERFKRPVPIEAVAYGEFLAAAEAVLVAFGLTVTRAARPARSVPPEDEPALPAKRSFSPVMVIGVAMLVLAASLIGWVMLHPLPR